MEWDGFQNTFATPFGMAIQKGFYPKLSGYEASGYIPTIGNNYETIWDGGGAYTYPSAATTMNVIAQASTPSDDNGVDVVIQGLDADYNEITETVTLGDDSAGGTSTTQEFLRINRAYIGNGQDPTDDITIEQDGNVYAQITFPYNTTQMAIYTVPANKKAFLTYASLSLEKQKEVVAKLMSRRVGATFVTGGLIGTTGSYQRNWVIPPMFNEKTDIEIRAKAGATTIVSASMQFVLEDR